LHLGRVKTDVELKSDVLAELEYEPGVKVGDVGVSVQDGIVTLNGAVKRLAWNNKACEFRPRQHTRAF